MKIIHKMLGFLRLKARKSRTIHYYEYLMTYAGDSYFFRNVFHLTEKQTTEDYASNSVIHNLSILQKVLMCKNLGVSLTDTIKQITETFHLFDSESNETVTQY